MKLTPYSVYWDVPTEMELRKHLFFYLVPWWKHLKGSKKIDLMKVPITTLVYRVNLS